MELLGLLSKLVPPMPSFSTSSSTHFSYAPLTFRTADQNMLGSKIQDHVSITTLLACPLKFHSSIFLDHSRRLLSPFMLYSESLAHSPISKSINFFSLYLSIAFPRTRDSEWTLFARYPVLVNANLYLLRLSFHLLCVDNDSIQGPNILN